MLSSENSITQSSKNLTNQDELNILENLFKHDDRTIINNRIQKCREFSLLFNFVSQKANGKLIEDKDINDLCGFLEIIFNREELAYIHSDIIDQVKKALNTDKPINLFYIVDKRQNTYYIISFNICKTQNPKSMFLSNYLPTALYNLISHLDKPTYTINYNYDCNQIQIRDQKIFDEKYINSTLIPEFNRIE